MTPQEAEVIQLVWQKEGRTELPIPEEDQIRILSEIRERMARIEAATLEVGLRAFRENRHAPRRHQLVVLLWITVAGSLMAIYYFLSRL